MKLTLFLFIALFSLVANAQVVLTDAAYTTGYLGVKNIQSIQTSGVISPGLQVSGDAQVVLNSGQGIVLKPGFKAGSFNYGGSFKATVSATFTDDQNNWVEIDAYNEDGSSSGKARQYMDNLGRTIQTQVTNQTAGTLMATQTLYDEQGRPYIASLPVPRNTNSFEFDGNLFGLFSGGVESSTKVGQYFSTLNTTDPTVAASVFPFTQVQYSNLNPGQVIKSAQAGEQLNMGSGHENQSYVANVAPEEIARLVAKGLTTNYPNLLKNITIDPNGLKNITYVNTLGQVVATCKGGGTSTFTATYAPTNLYGTPIATDIDVFSWTTFPTSSYTVYDLKTDNVTTSAQAGVFKIYLNSLTFVDGNPILSIVVNLDYNEYTIYNYDKAGRLVSTLSPLKTEGQSSMINSATYDNFGNILTSSDPDEGITSVKYKTNYQTRYTQNAQQAAENKFSYIKYDSQDRPFETGECSSSTAFSALTGNESNSFIDGLQKTNYKYIQYDVPDNYFYNTMQGAGFASNYTPHFTAGKVAKTYNYEYDPIAASTNLVSTTWFSYDYRGRIEWTVTQLNNMGNNTLNQNLKTAHYTYQNGHLLSITYQKDIAAEKFIHNYTYNADGQMANVSTQSPDESIPAEKANYKYYKDGSVKRIELGGTDQLQGLDMIYTINGWLKAINSPALGKLNTWENSPNPGYNKPLDPGGDGFTNNFGQDLFGLNLDYFNGDYHKASTFVNTGLSQNGLYNGIIKSAKWNLGTITGSDPDNGKEMAADYTYDNHYWLTQTIYGQYTDNINQNSSYCPNSYNYVPITEYASSSTLYSSYFTPYVDNRFNETFTYDVNGNMKSLKRNVKTGVRIDDLTYTYNNTNNKLQSLTDAVAGSAYNDVTGTHNYTYNNIGQTIKDYSTSTDGNVDITYTDAGLVKTISKNRVVKVKYDYNESGQRVKVTDYTTNTFTWYVRDAAGTILSIYTQSASVNDLHQAEIPFYGQKRIGSYIRGWNVTTKVYTTGTYNYEINDQTGNTRVIFTKGIGTTKTDKVSLVQAKDYYAYGWEMPGRSMIGINESRYAFEGANAEKDQQTGYTHFDLREFDTRTARWMAPDPYGQYDSPYMGIGNNPINLNDPDGGTTKGYRGDDHLGHYEPVGKSIGGYISTFCHNMTHVTQFSYIQSYKWVSSDYGQNANQEGGNNFHYVVNGGDGSNQRGPVEGYMQDCQDNGSWGHASESICAWEDAKYWRAINERNQQKIIIFMKNNMATSFTIISYSNYGDNTSDMTTNGNRGIGGSNAFNGTEVAYNGGSGDDVINNILLKLWVLNKIRNSPQSGHIDNDYIVEDLLIGGAIGKTLIKLFIGIKPNEETSSKLVDNLLESGEFKLTPKGRIKVATIKGDGNEIFNLITQGGEKLKSGAYKLADGTIVSNHISKFTGEFTIDINKAGQLFKIRFK